MSEEMFLKMKAEQRERDLLDNFASFARVQVEQVLKGSSHGMTLESAIERIREKIKLVMEETGKGN